ncbi:MAG: FdrA family protein [Nocardioidaceae bacterium]
MTRLVQIRQGKYQDSVSLMQVSNKISAHDDVTSALVAMATPLNVELLIGMGFQTPDGVSSNEMVIAIEADSPDAAQAAVAAVDEALAAKPAGSGASGTGFGPAGSSGSAAKTIGAAARRSQASLALVSTPGSVAAIDAADALSAGLDVMIFSDNVTVQQEIALKDMAAADGRLVMGPDCGTAVVEGVGLGFANVVRPGRVGIVAASGTGAQQVLALLDGAGVGVKHCLGVGGRDLSSDVGGRSTIAALDRLAGDDDISTILVVSKPPAERVATKVTEHANQLGKTVVFGYLGAGKPDLTATAAAVVATVGSQWKTPERWGSTDLEPSTGYLRGLFVGGTLCDEAMLITVDVFGEVASNIALAGQPSLDNHLTARAHTFIDFGDDRLTVGRPHPMIDPMMRIERLRAELADPQCAVVLLDVVLGYGAHPDPARALAPLIHATGKPVIVTLIGTRDDPQGKDASATTLADAGAIVHASNAAATREAINLIAGGDR